MTTEKRIAKNTMFLYIRMLLIMLVTLYTSRIILRTLGEEDYGIYNIVGGIVILFSFFNNAMVSATQRFLNYEIGKNRLINAQKYFSASIIIHIVIAILFLIIIESIGYLFFFKNLNIPAERFEAAIFVFHISSISAIINILRIPYGAVIVAKESMSFYAYVSVFETIGKLLIVFLLGISNHDKLKLYSLLMLCIIIITNMVYVYYCKTKLSSICKFILCKDRQIYLQLCSFSGWSVLGSMANAGANQGINIIINIFNGVILNTAVGIANQVNLAIYNFVSNFQVAFNPQIIKTFANSDKKSFFTLLFKTSKYSFSLIWILALPVLICTDEILKLWLGAFPEYTTKLTQLMIAFSILDAIQGPLWISVQATGKIRTYQIFISLMILMNLPISYLALSLGCDIYSVFYIKIFINLLIFIYRLFYIKKIFNFPVKEYLIKVVLIDIIIICITYPISYQISTYAIGISKILISILISVIITCFMVYKLQIDKEDKEKISKLLKRFL